jgi:hypothetical protein
VTVKKRSLERSTTILPKDTCGELNGDTPQIAKTENVLTPIKAYTCPMATPSRPVTSVPSVASNTSVAKMQRMNLDEKSNSDSILSKEDASAKREQKRTFSEAFLVPDDGGGRVPEFANHNQVTINMSSLDRGSFTQELEIIKESLNETKSQEPESVVTQL